MRYPFTTAAIIALVVGLPVFGDSGAAVVVLPFENLSGVEGAERDVAVLVIGEFTRRGWGVASPEPLEEMLRAERVRYLDVLDGASRSRILRETESRALVTGTIYEYSEGRNPTVALAVRITSATGTLVWSNVIVVSASDTEGLFGLGRRSTVIEVAATAVSRLIEPIPDAGGDLRMAAGQRRVVKSKPTFYVAREALESAPRLICVLPFVNQSQSANAARVVTDFLSLRLAATGDVAVVDAASLRAAVLELGLGSFRRISSKDLEALSARVGTPLMLRGTIYEYEVNRGPSGDPKLNIELTLSDTRTGRVVWAAQHERRGSDYEGLLLLGAEVSVVGLADRMLGDMIYAAGDALMNGERSQSAGLAPRRRSDLRGVGAAQPTSQAGGTP